MRHVDSVSKGAFSIRYNCLYAPVKYVNTGVDVPSGIKAAHMITVNYTY